MPEISIPWGDAPLAVNLPAEWSVQQVAEPSASAAGEGWGDRLATALSHPEHMPPLDELLLAARGGRIVLVVEDMTRHSPLPEILEIVFREIEQAGVSDGDVEIVIATGTHPPLTAAEAAQKLGRFAARIAWRCNDCRGSNAYVNLGRIHPGPSAGGGMDLWLDRGVVEARLRIVITSVSPHMHAGFGGGWKMLLPGCAMLESITRLHAAGVPRRPRQQVGQQRQANRMRRLVDAAGPLLGAAGGTTFGIQYVLEAHGGADGRDRVGPIAVGEVQACHEMLAKMCAARCGVLIDNPADVVIANAWPRDFDLWQSMKAIANCCWAARPNGVIICMTRCVAGVNKMPIMSLPVSPGMVRGFVRLLGADALASLMTRLVPRLSGDAAFFVRLAMQTVQRNLIILVSPTLAKAGVKVLGLPLVGDPAEAVALAQRHLGKGPQRVTVFPQGGVSYPIGR